MAIGLAEKPVMVITDRAIMPLLRPPSTFLERVERQRSMLLEIGPLADRNVIDTSAIGLAVLEERVAKKENAGEMPSAKDRDEWCRLVESVSVSHSDTENRMLLTVARGR